MSTFISYSRADSSFAVRLAKNLKSAGFDVWLDQLDIPTGARWDDEVETALEACKTFMIILSPESLESQNVKDEIGYAIDSGKEILPVKIKSGEIPFRLRRFQYVDFSKQSYQESLKEIKSILSTSGHMLAGINSEPEAGLVGLETQPADEQAKVPAREMAENEPAATKPRITKPQPRISSGLFIGLVALLVLAAAGIVISALQKNRVPAATSTSEVVSLQNGPTDQTTTEPTATATGISNQTQAGASGVLIAKFLNSSELRD